MDQTEGKKKKGVEVEEAKGKFHFLPINVIVTAQLKFSSKHHICYVKSRSVLPF